MKCVTEYMMWYDWASVILFYCLGIWKMTELIHKLPKVVAKYFGSYDE